MSAMKNAYLSRRRRSNLFMMARASSRWQMAKSDDGRGEEGEVRLRGPDRDNISHRRGLRDKERRPPPEYP
jgi:hypothetical protein